VEKCGTARQTTDDNTIRDMHIACWINSATDTHTHTHGIGNTAFPPHQSQHCTIVPTLPALFDFSPIFVHSHLWVCLQCQSATITFFFASKRQYSVYLN